MQRDVASNGRDEVCGLVGAIARVCTKCMRISSCVKE